MQESKIGQIMNDVAAVVSTYTVNEITKELVAVGLKSEQIEKIINIIKNSISLKCMDSVHFIFKSLSAEEKKDFKSNFEAPKINRIA